jgi:peptidoglycan/xylan/chitin deacetylase (PgdA/CDA1 family)
MSFCLGVCILVPLGAIMQSHSSLALENQKIGNNNQSPCNCVIFRMDDVHDNFIDEAQAAAMNLFVLKNQPLTLGLIMSDIGNDITISQHIAKGVEKGLFELGLHGWDHVDYTKLSEVHQKDSLKKANDKMQRLYGTTSNIFITPYGKFSDETINSMSQLGIKILSAATFSESDFDNNNSVFNANNYNRNAASVFHVPSMTVFKSNEANKKPIKIPIYQILSDVDSNIKRYGYAVIVFHPQDFVKTDQNGKLSNNLDQKELNDLSNLIDYLHSKGVPFTTMSKLVGIKSREFTSFSK